MLIRATVLFGAAAAAANVQAVEPARDYPVKPVPFTAVHFTDSFWLPRIEVNRTVTIPFAFEKCQESKRFYNFERAAAALRGETLTDKTPPGYPFDDTDPYKVLEGAAYTLSVKPDPKLEAFLDALVAKIAAAQEPDGYLYTARTIDPVSPHKWSGQKRWELEEVDSHELYDLGHLYEAAVAYYQATGKRTLLDVALRTADLLDRTFGPGKQTIWPGHQITEMGLVKLYRVTGEARYLSLAQFLLDARGTDGSPHARPYNQSSVPVVQQSEAMGHAVRATYMYSGMADVAALTGADGYVAALGRIWQDVVGRKLYVTGGIGAMSNGEAFGGSYELPNMSAYNETCAAIGNDYWNQRMFLLHADARYVDVLERTLYNGLLSGVSLDGKTLLLPEPARVGRPAQAQPLVRRRLLPRQHHALPGVASRLRLRAAGGPAVRQPLRRLESRREDGQRPDRGTHPGHALPLGRPRAAHRLALGARPLHALRPRPGLGARRARPERPLPLRGHREGAGHAPRRRRPRSARAREGLRAHRPRLEGGRRRRARAADARAPRRRATLPSRPTRGASRSSAARSSTRRSGPTTAATCATWCCRTPRRS